jgi:hypothetical protein
MRLLVGQGRISKAPAVPHPSMAASDSKGFAPDQFA